MSWNRRRTVVTAGALVVMSLLAGCGERAELPEIGAAEGGGEFVAPRFESEAEHERTSDPVPMHVPAAEPVRIVIGPSVLETPGSAHAVHTTFVVFNATMQPRTLTLSGSGQEPPSNRTIPPGETFEFDLTLEPGVLRVDAGEGYTGEIIVD